MWVSFSQYIRHEFCALGDLEGRTTSLMDSWDDLVEKHIQFGKIEAQTRLEKKHR